MTLRRFDKNIIEARKCPYCGRKPRYCDSKEIYGSSYGMVYYCKLCDAYVGVHHKTSKRALGRLANSELREAKKEAHKYFDPLWMRKMNQGFSKKEARNSAYEWLAKSLHIAKRHCHIGMFDVELCKQVVEICKPFNK